MKCHKPRIYMVNVTVAYSFGFAGFDINPQNKDTYLSYKVKSGVAGFLHYNSTPKHAI